MDDERALRGPAASDEIENPAAEQVIVKVGDAPEKDVDRAVRVASDAPVEWPRMHPRERGCRPRTLAGALHDHIDGLLVLDALGSGSLRSAMRNDVACGAAARPGEITRKVVGGMHHLWSRGLSYGLTSRALLHGSIADEGMEPFVDRVEALREGTPADPATETGPFSSRAQCDKLMRYIGTAHGEGATLLADGGGRTAIGREVMSGRQFRSTVFDRVTPDMTPAREEGRKLLDGHSRLRGVRTRVRSVADNLIKDFPHGNTRGRRRSAPDGRCVGLSLETPDFEDFACMPGRHGRRA